MITMEVRVGVQTDAWMGITRREVHNSCSIVKQLIYRLNAATQHNDVGGDFPFITESLFEGRVEWLFSALPSAHCRPLTQFGSIMRLEVECSVGCEKRVVGQGWLRGETEELNVLGATWKSDQKIIYFQCEGIQNAHCTISLSSAAPHNHHGTVTRDNCIHFAI